MGRYWEGLSPSSRNTHPVPGFPLAIAVGNDLEAVNISGLSSPPLNWEPTITRAVVRKH